MSRQYVSDMTQGSVVRHLLAFTLPMLVGNIFQQFYNMVDSIIVGRFVSSDALGAVGSVGSINFLFFSLCMGLGSGIGVLIAQYYGAGKTEEVKKIIANAIYITLAAGLFMSVMSVVLAKPILHLMNMPEENFADAYTYMVIVCGATFVVAAYNTISAILRALGDATTPLIFLVVSCLVNIVLDLWFVLGFGMGVAGAAWATVISQVMAAAGSILFAVRRNPYLKLDRRHFRPDQTIIRKSCQIGLPIAAQNALIAFSCVALQSVVNHFGSMVMAAYTATNRVEQLVQQPFGSLGTAVSTFSGQNVGAGKYQRVSEGYHKSVLIVALFSACMIAVMYLFAVPIMQIFVTDPEIIAIGAQGLRITSFMYVFLGMIYILRGLLNGVGDAAFAMVNGIMEVAGRIGFAWLLMAIPAVGIWGVWYTNGLTWTITGLGNLIRVRRGKWRKKSMITG